MKNILVTGGSGFIGSQVVKALLADGFNPIIVDWNMNWWKHEHIDSLNLIESNFKDSDYWAILGHRGIHIDAIIHLAAYHSVPDSMEQPKKYYQNNVQSTLKFFEQAAAHGVDHIIFSGSSSVYGNGGIKINKGLEIKTGNKIHTLTDTYSAHALKETDPIDPGSPYASCKAIVEMALKDYSRAYDFTYASLRYFNAAGADPDGQFGYIQEPAVHIVPIIAQRIRKGEKLQIFGSDYPTPDGTCVRDYTHVQDLADAHVKALKYLLNGGKNEVFNLGAGVGVSLLELMTAFREVTNENIDWDYAERRAGDPPYLMADINKAKEILGWEPQYSLEEIITHAINWDYKWSEKQKDDNSY